MGIKTVPHPPYSPDLAPCDFCLFPKLRGCRYETIDEMKEAVTKVIDTLTQEDFYRAFQKLLERYNKCISAEGNYLEGDWNFMCVLSIKVPIRKKYGNLSYARRIYSFVYILLVSMVKFLSMKQFPVDPLFHPVLLILGLFWGKFFAFAYEINRFISISK